MPSDEELLANLANKRKPGFTVLYKRYSDLIYRYALMVSGSASVAEEATQETFVHVIENATAFDPSRSSTARGWLYGLARNKVRAANRYQGRVAPLADNRSDKDSPDRVVVWSQVADETAAAILRLPLQQREVLVLCGLQEFDYATAATLLELPVGTVRSRLSRARHALRRALGDTGYTLEDLKYEAQ